MDLHFSARLLLLLLFCMPTTMAPVVTAIQVWRKQTALGNRYFITFLDWHTDYKDGRVGKTQQKEALEIFAQYPETLVIVEDIVHYDGHNKTILDEVQGLHTYYQSLAHNKNIPDIHVCDLPSFLCHGLIEGCKQQNIAWYNPDCRHFYYVQQRIAWQEIQEDFKRHLDELIPNKKNSILKPHLDTISFYMNRIFPENTDHLNFLGYYLFNAKIVNQLIMHAEKQVIFACIGTAHVISLEPDLKALGYEKVAQAGALLDFPDYEAAMAGALDLKNTFKTSIAPLLT